MECICPVHVIRSVVYALLWMRHDVLFWLRGGGRGGRGGGYGGGGDRRRDNYRDGGGSGPDRNNRGGNRARPY
ncbi:hypothetical protein CsSME_00041203 [Camellia sinensis var. sinensis]